VQLCGWIQNLELCAGGIDDSRYMETAGVLNEQKWFAEVDETSEESFLNTVDEEAHRCILAARKQGQNSLQPPSLQRVTNSSVGIKLFIVTVLW
jgi:hypothetical protein